MAEDGRRLDDVVVVEERLADAHEDDAADGSVFGLFPHREDLADDLRRREVALEAQRAGGAERARQRAADLALPSQRRIRNLSHGQRQRGLAA